jgi:hypothetical protein
MINPLRSHYRERPFLNRNMANCPVVHSRNLNNDLNFLNGLIGELTPHSPRDPGNQFQLALHIFPRDQITGGG